MSLAVPVAAAPAKHTLSFTKVWTHSDTTPRQVSEIPAFDHKTSTIWVAGVVGVDVLDAVEGTLVEHIDAVASVAANAKGLYMPASRIEKERAPAAYRFPGEESGLVLANEGNFREDNVDRSSAG